jgi:hypothetical protein
MAYRATARDRARAQQFQDHGLTCRALVVQVVDRQHVGTSAVSVLRTVRRALKPRTRAMAVYRPFRRACYLAALDVHAYNRGLFSAVAYGRPGELPAGERSAREALARELARYGRNGGAR